MTGFGVGTVELGGWSEKEHPWPRWRNSRTWWARASSNPVIDRVFGLADVEAALAYAEQPRGIGRVLLATGHAAD